MTYTLTPGDPPEEEDFVAFFLEDGRGYCVYFASAMTVLARCAGLPARYVTGFALHQQANRLSDQAYVATRLSAHAWTEIYIHGLGWLTFDPSGTLARPYYGQAEKELAPEHTPLPMPLPDETTSQEAQGLLEQTAQKKPWRLLWIPLGLLLLALLPIVASFRARSGSGRRTKTFKRRYPDPADRLMRLFNRSVQRLSWLGFEPMASETLHEYLDRVQGVQRLGGLKEAWLPVIHWLYGEELPSEAELERLWALNVSLEEALYQEKGVWRHGLQQLLGLGLSSGRG